MGRIMAVPWLTEVSNAVGVCSEAERDIMSKNPNQWWLLTERGDWMLYYIWATIVFRHIASTSLYSRQILGEPAQGLAYGDMNGIAKYVSCPRDLNSIYMWTSNARFPPSVRARVARAVRRIWPELPLA